MKAGGASKQTPIINNESLKLSDSASGQIDKSVEPKGTLSGFMLKERELDTTYHDKPAFRADLSPCSFINQELHEANHEINEH